MSISGRLESRMRRRKAKTVNKAQANLPAYTNGWLSSIISGQDSIPDEKRMDVGWIHATSLLDFCPRAFRLADIDDVTVRNSVFGPHRIMWAIGRALEHHVRTQFIAAHKEALIGDWSCKCGATHEIGTWKEKTCNSCKSGLVHYGELSLRHRELRIVGNPDMLIEDGGKVRVVEIKSINKNDFLKLEKPLANHVFQANIYKRLLAEEGMEAHDETIIFYVQKDFLYKSPYKEFHVDGREQERMIDLAMEKVKELRDSERDGEIPNRIPACRTPNSSKAKGCGLCVQCFNRED